MRTFNVFEVCERNVLSGFRAKSDIPNSDASVLPDPTTKSAKKLMDGRVSVQLLYVVSCTICSSALELSALKPWSVRPF